MEFASTLGSARRVAGRTIVLIVALVAALLFSTLANLTPTARAGQVSSEPLKAVVVVGPFSELTSDALADAEAIADAAEAQGMEVTRIFHPEATWSRVVDAANGANLFVYLGHGNGWPSPYPPFQEDTKDGLGLNYPDPDMRGAYQTKYYGANKIREQIRFAPNAVVILNMSCYTAGHGEQYMPMPSRSLALERVDNFASGFLASGAGVVAALEYQWIPDVVNALADEHVTMDGLFRMNFEPSFRKDGWPHPYGGWVGWDPTYSDSVRTPGARILMDPHPTESYRRAITGNLGMTTDEWAGTGSGGDTDAPVVSNLLGVQSPDTLPGGELGPVVFTPNGDGMSDSVTFNHTVSEPSYLDVEVTDADSGERMRRFATWTDGGDSSTVWDGKDNDGDNVREGRYDVSVTPKDRAGNEGAAQSVRVRAYTTMKSLGASPGFFFSADGDSLAQTSTLSVTLTRQATLSWNLVDAQGALVRTFLTDANRNAGNVSMTWDGKDSTGAYAPNGMYTQVVTAVTDAGTYSHSLTLRLMPFKINAKEWSGPAGTKVAFKINSAEPLTGWPRIEVRQPGLPMYTGYPLRYSAKKFKTTITFRSGGQPGPVQIRVIGNDTAGGSQRQTVWFELTE